MRKPLAWINAITGDVTTVDCSDTLLWAPLYYIAPLKDVNVDLLEALQDLMADLKLRASLTDEPNVLDVSHGRYIKAEKAIAKALGESYE